MKGKTSKQAAVSILAPNMTYIRQLVSLHATQLLSSEACKCAAHIGAAGYVRTSFNTLAVQYVLALLLRGILCGFTKGMKNSRNTTKHVNLGWKVDLKKDKADRGGHETEANRRAICPLYFSNTTTRAPSSTE